jgi:hypothetical protein
MASVKRFVSLPFLNLRHSVGVLGRVISPSQSRYLTQNKHTSMPRVGFEPMIPTFERAKTVHAIDRAATVIVKVAWWPANCLDRPAGEAHAPHVTSLCAGSDLQPNRQIHGMTTTTFHPDHSRWWKWFLLLPTLLLHLHKMFIFTELSSPWKIENSMHETLNLGRPYKTPNGYLRQIRIFMPNPVFIQVLVTEHWACWFGSLLSGKDPVYVIYFWLYEEFFFSIWNSNIQKS